MKRSPHGYHGRSEYDPYPDHSYDYDEDSDFDLRDDDRWQGEGYWSDRQDFDIQDDDIRSGGRQRTGRRRRISAPLAVLLAVIIVAAAGVLGVSVYKLLGIRNADRSRDDYWAKVEGNVSGDGDRDEAGIDTGDPDDPVFLGEADFSDHSFQWDYDKLLQMCADAVGYIYQTGVMSYPIVQAEDNDKYLRARLDGEYDVGGTIFVDARFEDGMEGKYSIVYGHNMYNSSMFGPLPEYEEKDYYKEHPYFDIYIGYRHYRYYVFSAFVAEADGYVYTYELEEGRFKEQFDRLRADGLYETDVRELREDDHVIVLSTCVDFHDYAYRNVVCLVRGEEVIDEEGL